MRTEEINLKDVWAVEQSILDGVADFCEENGLCYSLAYGTLLGAVRHGGFIPWDDDIDILMPREDYNRLMELWPQGAPEGLILDRCDLDPENNNTFSKIRKDHTTFLQFDKERNARHHKGVFIDIFPADRAPKNRFARKLQYVDFAMMLLFNRGYRSGNGGLIGLVERVLLWIVPKKKYHSLSLFFAKRGERWNGDRTAQVIVPITIGECKRYYPADLFDNMQMLPFHGKQYRAVRDTDTFLTIRYGDYRSLPPEEERTWKHPPLLIDFERNYEEIPENER